MPAVTLGNLIHQDEFSDTRSEELSEYTRPPDDAAPVQIFPDIANVILATAITQKTWVGGAVICINETITDDNINGYVSDVLQIDGATGVVSSYIPGATAWAGIATPPGKGGALTLRAQVDNQDRLHVIYTDDNIQDPFSATPASVWARRFTSAGAVEQTIAIEDATLIGDPVGTAFDTNPSRVVAAAVSPTGQYVYLLLLKYLGAEPSIPSTPDSTQALLYQYDLDNAGARSLLKVYDFFTTANNAQYGQGLALACHHDGSILVGHWTVTIESFDYIYHYWVDQLTSEGTVVNTWPVYDTVPTLADGTSCWYLPSFATGSIGSEHRLWGFFADNTGNTPGGIEFTKLLEVNLSSGAVVLHDWNTSLARGWDEFYTIWPFPLRVTYPGLARVPRVGTAQDLFTRTTP